MDRCILQTIDELVNVLARVNARVRRVRPRQVLLDYVGRGFWPRVLPLKLVGLDRIEELVVVVILLLVIEAELTEETLTERLLIDYVVVRLARQIVLKMNALGYVRKIHKLSPFLAAAFAVIWTTFSSFQIYRVCHDVL